MHETGRFFGAADEELSIVGLDAARNAVSYAVDVGIMDAGVSTNLEREEPSGADLQAVENSDMIISTGCVGYVTKDVAGASGRGRPGQGRLDGQFRAAHVDTSRWKRCWPNVGMSRSAWTARCFPKALRLGGRTGARLDNLRRRGISPEEASARAVSGRTSVRARRARHLVRWRRSSRPQIAKAPSPSAGRRRA